MFTKKGFTLIEVLVVVLIIGILSGVAVREYQRSVHRAEATEASMLIAKVRDAMADYGAEFGHCPSSVDGWGIPVVREALEFYNYEGYETESGLCGVVITPKSSKGLKARLVIGATGTGLPEFLFCSGSDCDVFSPFGCEATEDTTENKRLCTNFTPARFSVN